MREIQNIDYAFWGIAITEILEELDKHKINTTLARTRMFKIVASVCEREIKEALTKRGIDV